MNLGENIYRLRTSKNMSQGDLADALEVSRQSVSKWENDSAVPELEKLIKMSELFGVTLDELVGTKRAPETSQTTEPNTVYVQVPVPSWPTHRQLTGGILLLGSFLLAFMLDGDRFTLGEIMLMVLPFSLMGVLCLTTRHALFGCGWVGAAAYWIWFFCLTPRWEESTFLLILGAVFVAVMVVASVRIHRSGRLRIPAWAWIVGTVVLAFLTWLLLVNTIPPLPGTVHHATPG